MLWRHTVEQMSAYVPGESSEQLKREFGLTNVIKLDSNENPLGTSPRAITAMQRELGNAYAYPDSPPSDLQDMLSAVHAVNSDSILVANGADNVLAIICAAYLNPADEAVYCTPTFATYRLRTLLSGGVPIELPLTSNLQFDLQAISSRLTAKTKLVFLCNPNNPTGTMLESAEIEHFLQTLPQHVIVVLDEAYIDFVSQSCKTGIDFVKAGYPVISVRTFSKMYGLAGLRIGYAVACSELLLPMHTVREPFTVNRIGIAGAMAALADDEFAAHVRQANAQGMAYLMKSAGDMGMNVIPSTANFALVDLHRDANEVCAQLRRRGILVRPGAGWGLPSCVRVTIGTHEQLQTLVNALSRVFEAQPNGRTVPSLRN